MARVFHPVAHEGIVGMPILDNMGARALVGMPWY